MIFWINIFVCLFVENMLKKNLEIAFSTSGERAAAKFLKDNAKIVLYTISWTSGHSKYVLSEFMLGSRYKADLVVLVSYSGAWDVHFIELENTDDKIITKEGKPSARLNSALSQVHDWEEYIELNQSSVKRDLAEACKKRDLLGWSCKDSEPSNFSGNLLRDPQTAVRFQYHIIIGRRDKIDETTRRKMNQYSKGIAKIGSFDRFLDVAENFDIHEKDKSKSILLTEKRGD